MSDKPNDSAQAFEKGINLIKQYAPVIETLIVAGHKLKRVKAIQEKDAILAYQYGIEDATICYKHRLKELEYKLRKIQNIFEEDTQEEGGMREE